MKMIRKVILRNFKIYKELEIPLSNLNLLTGVNAMGKSSIIQSLLLLRQSFKKNKIDNQLELYGDLIHSGNGRDILHRNAETRELEISLEIENNEIFQNIYSATEDENKKNYLPLKEKRNFQIENISLFTKNFQYINAEHLGPNKNHMKNDSVIEQDNQISEIKGRAEYTIHYLFHNKNKDVKLLKAIHQKARDEKLLSQVEAWLREISPNVETNIVANEKDLDLYFKFKTFDDSGASRYTDNFEPQNVGFALSYTLPYLVAILSAEPGSLLLLENPEAHLHPYGQAKLAELMCKAAESRVQIIAETHSDHIVNETLVQLKEHSKNSNMGLKKENLKIHYLEIDYNTFSGKAYDINPSQEGKIFNPPEGFFDQFAKHRRQMWGA